MKPGLGVSGGLVVALFVVFYYMVRGLLLGIGQLVARLLWGHHNRTM